MVGVWEGEPYCFEPETFNASLASDDIPCSIDHLYKNLQIGSTADGSFRIITDSVGLRFELNQQTVRSEQYNVHDRARRLAFRGASIGYRVEASYPGPRGVQVISKATLTEISLCLDYTPKDQSTWVALADPALALRFASCQRCRRGGTHGVVYPIGRCQHCGHQRAA